MSAQADVTFPEVVGLSDAGSVIAAAFATTQGRLLDVGCGRGAVARALSDLGFRMTGLDPGDEALQAARSLAPEARFVSGGAQALPFAAETFDGVIFVNSLHHVPMRQMGAALEEAARVVCRSGTGIVIEPLSRGSSFSVLRLIEDETEVRAAAQACIEGAARDGLFQIERIIHYTRREAFADIAQFLARAVSVDRAREPLIAAKRLEIEAAFHANAARRQDGAYVLDQPMRVHVLRKPSAARA